MLEQRQPVLTWQIDIKDNQISLIVGQIPLRSAAVMQHIYSMACVLKTVGDTLCKADVILDQCDPHFE